MPLKGVSSDQAAESDADGNINLSTTVWPIDPLQRVTGSSDAEFRRRTIQGILESYHSSYDVLAEGLQNAVDAVEDASLAGLAGPYFVQVTINLSENWLAIMDSGSGMSLEQVTSAFAPNVSFKDPATSKRDKKHMYRGYKGVGLTFLAYGTDDITIHSKTPGGEYTKAVMRYGRSWAERRRADAAVMVEDTGASPLDKLTRGTYLKVQFSPATRPKSLSKLAASRPIWETIVRTKTALGQVLLGRDSMCQINHRSPSSKTDGRQIQT